MRHKWKKLKGRYDVDYGGEYRVTQCMTCIRCGLKKGSIKLHYWPSIAYFKDSKVLSVDRIPFKCFPIPKDFIEKEEFYV